MQGGAIYLGEVVDKFKQSGQSALACLRVLAAAEKESDRDFRLGSDP
jgi:hypothetical protein